MNFDLDKLSLKELKDLHSRVGKAISTFEDRKKKEAINAIEEQARSYGFSLADLVGTVAPRKRRPASAKYRNPSDESETWTGRGRKPRWVEDALKSGRRIEDLLI